MNATRSNIWILLAALILGIVCPLSAAAQEATPVFRNEHDRLRWEVNRLKRQLATLDTHGKSDVHKELQHLRLEARKIKLELDAQMQVFRENVTIDIKDMKINLASLSMEAHQIFDEIGKALDSQRENASKELARLEHVLPEMPVERPRAAEPTSVPKLTTANTAKPAPSPKQPAPPARAFPAPRIAIAAEPPPPPKTKKEIKLEEDQKKLMGKNQEIVQLKEKLTEAKSETKPQDSRELLLQLASAYRASQEFLSSLEPSEAEKIVNSEEYQNMQMGGYEGAVLTYKMALSLKPDDAYTHFAVGDIYDKLHDGLSALNYMEKSRRLYLASGQKQKADLVEKVLDALSYKYSNLQVCTAEARGVKNCG